MLWLICVSNRQSEAATQQFYSVALTGKEYEQLI